MLFECSLLNKLSKPDKSGHHRSPSPCWALRCVMAVPASESSSQNVHRHLHKSTPGMEATPENVLMIKAPFSYSPRGQRHQSTSPLLSTSISEGNCYGNKWKTSFESTEMASCPPPHTFHMVRYVRMLQAKHFLASSALTRSINKIKTFLPPGGRGREFFLQSHSFLPGKGWVKLFVYWVR